MSANITNIKVSILFTGIEYANLFEYLRHIRFKKLDKFLIIQCRYTYVIFKSDKLHLHCNITKLRHYKDIERSKLNLLNIFNKKICILSTRVDNICATKNLYKKLDLDLLSAELKSVHSDSQYSLKYNNQKFPGLFICFNRAFIKGTIACFKTGKINYVRVTDPLNFIKIEEWVKHNLE